MLYHLGVLPWGYLGVPVFLAISGFLIATQLRDGRPLGAFTLARIARIAPLAWTVALAGWFLGLAGAAPLWVLLTGQIWLSPVGPPLAVLWSLGVEEVAYLTAPAWLRGGLVVPIGLAAWAAGALVSASGVAYEHPAAHLGHFALGALAAVVPVPSAVLWWAVLAAVAALEPAAGRLDHWAWACPIAGVGGAALAALAIREETPAVGWLSWCGVRCLGVYLLHPWVILAGVPWWAVVPTVVLAAGVSWALVERPARALSLRLL